MAINPKKEILVYAHWLGIADPLLMGILSVSSVKRRESFSFEYTNNWLQSSFFSNDRPGFSIILRSFLSKG
jgi:serine/threonine-protein kinase HipA